MTIRASLRRFGGVFLLWLAAAARDALGVMGLGAIAYGCWLFAPAAGFVVGGLESVAVCALLTAASRGGN